MTKVNVTIPVTCNNQTRIKYGDEFYLGVYMPKRSNIFAMNVMTESHSFLYAFSFKLVSTVSMLCFLY